MMPQLWMYYFPDDGETKDDAREFMPTDYIFDAEDAAQLACERVWNCHDGWERGVDNSFKIAVVSPDGEVTMFDAVHEASVNHRVTEA